MSLGRYFIALALPTAERAALLALQVPKRGFAWTRPEQMHVTLRFIGALEAARAMDLAEALAAVRVEPFFLPLEGLGVFPPRGTPRVVWVGVGKGHPHLFQLRQRIDDTLLACGIEADVRRFHPHVTLARLRPEASAGAVQHFLKSHRGFEGPIFRVEHFGLYASELTSEGAVHTLVAEFALRGLE